jgi:hypothetical protein
MAFDFSKVLSDLGDEMIAKCGEPAGLSKDQSVRVAHALAAHFSKGESEAVKAAAADTGLAEEVVAATSKKLIEAGKDKLMQASGAGKAIDDAKAQAKAAIGNAGGEMAKSAGGFLGRLFGRR